MPIVVSPPWPGMTLVSGARVKRRSSMERTMVGKSPPSNLVAPGPPGKSVSPALQAQAADLDDGVVLENEVIGRQHRGVLGSHAHLVSGVAHLGHGLDVVPVAVGLEDLAHVQPLAKVQELVVLVGGVEHHGVARLPAPHDEHVVVHRPDHHLGDLDPLVLVVHGSGLLQL